MSEPVVIQVTLFDTQQQKVKACNPKKIQQVQGEGLNQQYISNKEIKNIKNLTVGRIIQKICNMDAFAEQWSSSDKTMGIQFLKKCFNRLNIYEQLSQEQQKQKWKTKQINVDILKKSYKKISKQQQELQKQLNYVEQGRQGEKKKQQQKIYQKILKLVKNSNVRNIKHKNNKQHQNQQNIQKFHHQKQQISHKQKSEQPIKQPNMDVENQDDGSSSFNMDRQDSLSSSHEDIDRDADNFDDYDRDESDQQNGKNINDGYESNGQYDQKQQNDNEDGNYNSMDDRPNDD